MVDHSLAGPCRVRSTNLIRGRIYHPAWRSQQHRGAAQHGGSGPSWPPASAPAAERSPRRGKSKQLASRQIPVLLCLRPSGNFRSKHESLGPCEFPSNKVISGNMGSLDCAAVPRYPWMPRTSDSTTCTMFFPIHTFL